MTLKDKILSDLQNIRYCIWERDIPSSTVPEYVEHHRWMQELMKIVNDIIETYENRKINEWQYHPADEPPEDDRYILLDYVGFIPGIGHYEGGAYYYGSDDIKAIDVGIGIRGWWELPERPGDA